MLPYDLRCENYNLFKLQVETTCISFLTSSLRRFGQLLIYFWNEKAIAEHNCTTGCLPRHNSSDSCSASDIIHVVDGVKNNELNNFYFHYSCSIFVAVCNSASATDDDILDHTAKKTCSCSVSSQKLFLGLKIPESKIIKFQKADPRLCDVCARSKITQHSFDKVHKI